MNIPNELRLTNLSRLSSLYDMSHAQKYVGPLLLKRSPKTIDDSHARFENKQKPLQFFKILNKEDSSIHYTIEFENDQKQLNFLDITTNNGTNSYDFTSYTNVQIKSNSKIATQTLHPIFPLQFLEGSYLELIKSDQNTI